MKAHTSFLPDFVKYFLLRAGKNSPYNIYTLITCKAIPPLNYVKKNPNFTKKILILIYRGRNLP
jgi:hypothetical protein